MRNLIGLVTALTTTALAACSDPPPKCHPFAVGQRVHVIAYPSEHYVVTGTGFFCSAFLWKPGMQESISLPPETLELDN